MSDITNQSVVNFARANMGQQVGSGECWDLAEEALTAAGAKTSRDYGRVTANADYRWGTEVSAADLRPGDIVQYRNYRWRIRYTVTRRDGSSSFYTFTLAAPHHTAIVETVRPHHEVVVLDQNSGERPTNIEAMVQRRSSSALVRRVHRSLLITAGSTRNIQDARGDRIEITVTVRGRLRFYRPQERETQPEETESPRRERHTRRRR